MENEMENLKIRTEYIEGNTILKNLNEISEIVNRDVFAVFHYLCSKLGSGDITSNQTFFLMD